VPHLLCIGDAAHAMSPIGGVGINLAIQDAVAAANILSIPLARGPVPVELLAEVQSRRELAVKLVQGIQSFIQRNFVSSLLSSHQAIPVPPLVRLLGAVPYLRRIPAYLIGIGFRPENVRSPSKEAG
jgi:2-polyprenyl-6-methoxyphenol hydroxylase-like FAD-dependent oxidoreductase